MSLKLLTVELHNIRAHEHLVYTPGAEGISVIKGENGTGKSTIIDSIAWAIYGVKPTGVARNSMLVRDGVDIKNASPKPHVVLDFLVDGQHLRVQRRIMSKTLVEADVWAVLDEEPAEETENITVTEDGEVLQHLAGSAVSQVTSYLVKRLRMDAKGFLAAVMVQQKEVDSLILSPAGERARVIEKLTGISALTEALKLAADEHNELKSHAAKSSVDEGAILEHEKSLKKIAKEKQKLEKQRSKLEDQYIQHRDKARELRDTLAEQEEAYSTAESLQHELTSLETRIESAEEELSSLNDDRKAKRAQLSSSSGAYTLEEIEETHQDLMKRLRVAQNNVDTAKKNATETSQRIATLEELTKDQTAAAVSKELAEKTTEHANLEVQEQEFKMAINSREQENKKTAKAIDILKKGHGTCPSCLQEVEDITDVVKNLQAQIDENTAQNTKDQAALDKAVADAKALHTELDTLSKIAEAFGQLDQLQADLKRYNEEHARYGSDAKILEKEFKNSEKKLYDARRSAETKREYDRLLARSKKVSDTIESAKKRVDEIQKQLKDSKVISHERLVAQREKFSAMRDKLGELKNDVTEKRGEIEVAATQETHLTKDLERLKEDLQRHKDLLQSVELAASSRKLVEEFRTARIESAIPVIEVYASDLLSAFTDGHFVGIQLDAKFNASVKLANGTVRPVTLLSGGELSAAAIALRLAISMMLNGGDGSQLMILDEVLVSQDIHRAEKILHTVKDVLQGQVVMIAHSEIVESVADYVFDMHDLPEEAVSRDPEPVS